MVGLTVGEVQSRIATPGPSRVWAVGDSGYGVRGWALDAQRRGLTAVTLACRAVRSTAGRTMRRDGGYGRCLVTDRRRWRRGGRLGREFARLLYGRAITLLQRGQRRDHGPRRGRGTRRWRLTLPGHVPASARLALSVEEASGRVAAHVDGRHAEGAEGLRLAGRAVRGDAREAQGDGSLRREAAGVRDVVRGHGSFLDGFDDGAPRVARAGARRETGWRAWPTFGSRGDWVNEDVHGTRLGARQEHALVSQRDRGERCSPGDGVGVVGGCGVGGEPADRRFVRDRVRRCSAEPGRNAVAPARCRCHEARPGYWALECVWALTGPAASGVVIGSIRRSG